MAAATLSNEADGVALGVLIGVVTGCALLFLLARAKRLLDPNTPAGRSLPKELTAASTELLAIPTFWFGGPWVSGSLMLHIDLDALMPFYMITLSVVFLAITFRTLLNFIDFIGKYCKPSRRARRT